MQRLVRAAIEFTWAVLDHLAHLKRPRHRSVRGCIVSLLLASCVLPDSHRSEEFQGASGKPANGGTASKSSSRGGSGKLANGETANSSTQGGDSVVLQGGSSTDSLGHIGGGAPFTSVRSDESKDIFEGGIAGNSTRGGSSSASGKPANAGTASKSSSRGGNSNGSQGGSSVGSLSHTGGRFSGSPIVSCELGTTDLLDDAAKSESFNWVGGDNTTDADDPCGFQGAFYAYSDKGADGVAGNADDSLQKPAFKSGTEYESPCVEGKCCISGTTSLWPSKDVYTTWGAGVGFSFSDAGDGDGKRAYIGPARGIKIMLEGSIKKQVIRFGLTQTATDESAPFVSIPGPFSGEKEVTLMFSDPTCPTSASACIDPAETPYDLQIQIAGGVAGADGPFELCITSLVPIK